MRNLSRRLEERTCARKLVLASSWGAPGVAGNRQTVGCGDLAPVALSPAVSSCLLLVLRSPVDADAPDASSLHPPHSIPIRSPARKERGSVPAASTPARRTPLSAVRQPPAANRRRSLHRCMLHASRLHHPLQSPAAPRRGFAELAPVHRWADLSPSPSLLLRLLLLPSPPPAVSPPASRRSCPLIGSDASLSRRR